MTDEGKEIYLASVAGLFGFLELQIFHFQVLQVQQIHFQIFQKQQFQFQILQMHYYYYYYYIQSKNYNKFHVT